LILLGRTAAVLPCLLPFPLPISVSLPDLLSEAGKLTLPAGGGLPDLS
jgi:hypothetical protein